jgi:UDP-2-acetamido-3-amino-2,3-dideoxy-glucuronate N-acetyltransferase
MIKIAVVGSGYWGKNLVRNFHLLGSLGAICDKDPQVLSKFQEKYQEIPGVCDFDDLLDDSTPSVDALVIASPAETHYALAKKGLMAGKHVFAEKPLSLTVEEGRELVELAEQYQLTLMVGHILHYHQAVIKLKELVDSGELGKIQYLYSNRLNIGKIRSEENILWSFAPHDISTILMLLGEMPESVYATAGTYLQQHIPDTTLTALDFPGGVKAHIFVSWLHPFKEQKLVVVGGKKMAVFDDTSQNKLLLYPHKIEWVERIPVASKADAEVVPVDMEEPLKVECRHFLECIANQQIPRTDGKEGLRVLQVLQASQESLDRNGVTITLTESSNLAVAGGFIHESSYIDNDVEIGAGTKIWHFSHILSGSHIGERCNIGQNVVIGPKVSIGNNCKIQNNVSIYEGVTLEDGVFCGPSMVFTNVYNPRAEIRKMDQLKPVLVKKGATIGASATIICGTTLGRYCFIGASAVVTKDVSDHALVVGNPARQTGWACKCGEKVDSNLICTKCGKEYKKGRNGLEEK